MKQHFSTRPQAPNAPADYAPDDKLGHPQPAGSDSPSQFADAVIFRRAAVTLGF